MRRDAHQPRPARQQRAEQVPSKDSWQVMERCGARHASTSPGRRTGPASARSRWPIDDQAGIARQPWPSRRPDEGLQAAWPIADGNQNASPPQKVRPTPVPRLHRQPAPTDQRSCSAGRRPIRYSVRRFERVTPFYATAPQPASTSHGRRRAPSGYVASNRMTSTVRIRGRAAVPTRPGR